MRPVCVKCATEMKCEKNGMGRTFKTVEECDQRLRELGIMGQIVGKVKRPERLDDAEGCMKFLTKCGATTEQAENTIKELQAGNPRCTMCKWCVITKDVPVPMPSPF